MPSTPGEFGSEAWRRCEAWAKARGDRCIRPCRVSACPCDCPPRWKTHRPCDRSRTFGWMPQGRRTDTVPLCSRNYHYAGKGRERIDCLWLGWRTSRSRGAVRLGTPASSDNCLTCHRRLGLVHQSPKGRPDRCAFVRPDGQQISINRSEPLDRAKASYSAFAGKKGAPKAGVYEVKVAVERGGSVLFERSGTYSIE